MGSTSVASTPSSRPCSKTHSIISTTWGLHRAGIPRRQRPTDPEIPAFLLGVRLALRPDHAGLDRKAAHRVRADSAPAGTHPPLDREGPNRRDLVRESRPPRTRRSGEVLHWARTAA